MTTPAPPPTPSPSVMPSPRIILASAVVAVVVLALAKAVLIPLALAFYLAFVLTPPVKGLERLGLSRILAVIVTVGLAVGIVTGLGTALAFQVQDLSADVSQYTASMRHKVASLHRTRSSSLQMLQTTANRVGEELDEKTTEAHAAAPVRVIPDKEPAWKRLEDILSPLVHPLGFMGITLVLVVFMLGQREDLRDRVIRLVGRGTVTVTTRAMDEAGRRISRFLLALSLINLCFGALIAGGLFLIGVPYALLWGVMAALLRFVPYVGSLMSLVMPTLLAFAYFPTWKQTLETLGLYLMADFSAAYFIEPLLVGNRTGVSSLALLASSIFWGWLWGPIGLLLSAPLTVCAAVLGRHIPELKFLGVVLSEEPALDPQTRLYQRLLSHDLIEAGRIVRAHAKEHGPVAVMDSLLIPALAMALRDHDCAAISEQDWHSVHQGVKTLGAKLARERPPGEPKPTGEYAPVLALAAHDAPDALLLQLLDTALEPKGTHLEALAANTPPAEQVREAVRRGASVVCIATLPPAAASKARFLCRRLRAELPGVRILVLRPSVKGDDRGLAAARLREAGADVVVSGVEDAAEQVAKMLGLPASSTDVAVGPLALALR